MRLILNVRHWLPILTFCPVNNLPDFIYVTVKFETFCELYAVRKKIKELLSLKTIFMEGAAKLILDAFPEATEVTVTLAFNRHVVVVRR